jgi:hypothetical protein
LKLRKLVKIDDECEGIKLKLKSCIEGKIIEKIGSSKYI